MLSSVFIIEDDRKYFKKVRRKKITLPWLPLFQVFMQINLAFEGDSRSFCVFNGLPLMSILFWAIMHQRVSRYIIYKYVEPRIKIRHLTKFALQGMIGAFCATSVYF